MASAYYPYSLHGIIDANIESSSSGTCAGRGALGAGTWGLETNWLDDQLEAGLNRK